MGLLYVQIMYMENMIKMRNGHFSEAVKRSLYNVSNKLEKDETKYYLIEDLMDIEKSIYSNYLNWKEQIKESKLTSTPEKSIIGLLEAEESVKRFNLSVSPNQESSIDSYKNIQENIKGLYLYQQGLLNEVILTILSDSSSRPITERADSAVVKEYLDIEFENNGITIPYEYALLNRQNQIVYNSNGYENIDPNRQYTQVLFTNDPVSNLHYLKVYFPFKTRYIFSSIQFMIPSFAFTLILLVIFLYTIIIAFKQKKLTEMKNDFINNMTHEFKTPISTISLAAQMLNDDSVRKSNTMLQHISTVINDETKRLRFQVEKVLQMSMFERQKATLKLQDVQVNTVVANVVHTYKIKVEKYGGKIESHLDAIESTVHVDEMHFTNVIFNLLDNAVKYRREEEPLILSVYTKEIANNRIQISIQDNGIGIKREDLKKIFEKFFRVSTGNRHDVKGFGLGLAYVHKMVTELKGDIHVESELNKGTTFIITLPLIKN